jgi:hypothetical protein
MHTDHPYAHRTNRDGTIDSICKTCFMTVGTHEDPAYLKSIEDGHECEMWRLQVVNVVTQNRSGSGG